MKFCRNHIWKLIITLCILASSAGAGPTGPVQETIFGATESTRAKLLDYLARGDISGAISMYAVHTGRQAPSWLRNLQVAYSTASQTPGKCQEVARTIHTALSQLGQSPQYVAFRSKGGSDYIIFEIGKGKHAPVSRTGYHVAVKLGEMIHDAYTGPKGLELSEYLTRLQARNAIAWEVVSKP